MFFVGSFCSCVSEPEEVTFFNPDQEFLIDLNQVLSSDGPHLVFEISSLDYFNCAEVIINSNLKLSGTSIDLQIENFEIPENCSIASGSGTNIGPLETAKGNPSIFLDALIYDISISAQDLFSNMGSVYSGNNQFRIEMGTTDGITVGRKTLNKIPNNHVWGWISTQGTATSFLEDLSPFVYESDLLMLGDYGHFNVIDSDHLNIPGISGALETTFIYEIDDEDGLREYVKNIRENFTDVELSITLSNGEEL